MGIVGPSGDEEPVVALAVVGGACDDEVAGRADFLASESGTSADWGLWSGM